MMLTDEQKDKLLNEFEINTARSSGPGGQHVNKVNTKVEVRLNIDKSSTLSDEQKMRIINKLKSKLTHDTTLIIVVQTTRSRLKNKNEAIDKCFALLEKALKPVKTRKPTKPTLVSKQKRLDDKKIHSQKKNLRKNIDL